jgi:hypothetical protein
LAETSRALKPTQQLHHLKLGSNHHNELPEIFQHLATISGAAGCLFDLHSMMMGLVTLKSLKKTGSAQLKRISFMQKQELLCKEILHLKNATWHVKTQSLHQSILSSGVWQQRCLKPKQRCHRKDFGPGLDFVSGHFGLFQ